MSTSINKSQLINSLKATVTESLNITRQLSEISDHLLLQAPAPGAWNIAQIIEHLNTYNAYYLPLIREAFATATPLTTSQVMFKPGRLGNYFVKLMEPTNRKVKKKMKAAKKHVPQVELNAAGTIAEFIEGQNELASLLERARRHDIQHLSTSISILPFVRLRIGDVFRFLLAHQQRHFLQIEDTKAAVTEEESSNVLN